VNELVISFIPKVFKSGLYEQLLECSDPSAAPEFLEKFKLLLFSHRHNKSDAYLADIKDKFDVVRDPMYKYSKTS